MKVDADKLFELAKQARVNSHSPYSNFAVGASLVTDDGQYYTGSNVENACYAMGQCAEASAIGGMITGGGRMIRAVMIVTDTAEPVFSCGGCLQRISEFASADTEVISATLNGKIETHKFTKLYPMAFTAKSLNANA